MSEQKIYDGLLNWLKLGWYGMPESEELMPLIKATFTPDEAALLLIFLTKEIMRIHRMNSARRLQGLSVTSPNPQLAVRLK